MYLNELEKYKKVIKTRLRPLNIGSNYWFQPFIPIDLEMRLAIYSLPTVYVYVYSTFDAISVKKSIYILFYYVKNGIND